MKRNLVFFGLILSVGFVIFFFLGRSIYIPILNKFRGKETVQSLKEKIESTTLERLKADFEKVGLNQFPKKIIIVGLKEERRLEIYFEKENQIKQLKNYPFTAFSGDLGPKLKEGDRQIPEGIYKIEYLNPNSSYHLSLKVSYPNQFDKSKAVLDKRTKLGGDIFIHGKEVTIGCIPIGDQAIEEVFMLAQNAFNRTIKVIISPRDFRKNNVYPDIEKIDWENELYQMIEKELKLLPEN